MVRHGGLPELENFAPYAPAGAGAKGIATAMARQIPSSHDCSEIGRIRALWPGTLVIKGIMDPRDAVLAFDTGANAVTVSNHGGNKSDRMPAAIHMLSDVVRAVGAERPVLFDGGIRQGSDVITALGLGAAFCMLGRAPLYGAMAGGTRGVLRAIDILHADIRRTQVMMGCPTVLDFTPELIMSHTGPRAI